MSDIVAAVKSDPFMIYKKDSELGFSLYSAGFPSYPANFSRDSLKAGLIAGRADILHSQLEVSTHYQGRNFDALTGEQPGKIHHEMPGAKLAGRGDLLTTYNACDTTPLFLIATEGLTHLDPTKAESFIEKRRASLEKAAEHILSMVDNTNNLYWDKHPDQTRYCLQVTYWKDSILPHSEGKLEPVYPVTFGHSHFIAARGLLSASRLLNRPDLADKADAMFIAGIKFFMQYDDYIVYRDAEGELKQPSSDELHALAYIPANYASLLPLAKIKERSQHLATPYGFMCTPISVAQKLHDQYHGHKIWVFEQAKIHYGAEKFGMREEADCAAAIAKWIGQGQELFGIEYQNDGTIKLVPEGNDQQLWSVAAAKYFSGLTELSFNAWL